MQAPTRTAIERQAYALGAACRDADGCGIELQLASVRARFEEVEGDLVALCVLASLPTRTAPFEHPDEDDPIHWIDTDATRWWIDLDAAAGRLTCRAQRSLDATSTDGSAARVQHFVDTFMRLCELLQTLDTNPRAAFPPLHMTMA